MNCKKTTKPETTSKIGNITKQLLIISAFAVSVSGCVSAKIDKWVDKKYSEKITPPAKQKNDYITVTTSLVPKTDATSITEREAKNFLPLLFYWHLEEKYTCALNPKIAVNNFTTTILTYANRGLKQKLNGRRLELSIDVAPQNFIFDNKENMIWLIYGYNWNFINIQPDNKNLVVSYKLLTDDKTELKKGIVAVGDLNKKITVKIFQSPKRKILEYLDDYEVNMATMSKRVIDKLIAEL